MAQRLLAVYGTLKRGYGNHHLIVHKNLQFFGTAVTKDPAFTMFGGGFPIVTEEPKHHVSVELFSFDNDHDIEMIDRLEGHPNWYVRKPFTFVTGKLTNDGDYEEGEIVAEMYVMPSARCGRRDVEHLEHPTVNVVNGIAKWSYK